MPLPTWPSTLPVSPERGNFEHGNFLSPNVVTEVEDGPAIQRRHGLTMIERLPYRLFVNSTQLAAFKAFWLTTLGRGGAHFSMSVPAEGATYSTRRVYIEGGEWRAPALGGGWFALTFTLCVFPAA